MGEIEAKRQEEEAQQENEKEVNESSSDESGKRKQHPGEDQVEIAKQKAQEIVARLLVHDSDSKRPRFDYPAPPPPPPLPVAYATQSSQYSPLTSKKITIPNGKVGVVIGKGGETIKYIQLQSGAKIQITKDQEADPHSLTRDVDLMGTTEQIDRAEQLINDVIAEADSGGVPSSMGAGPTSKQSGAEQFSMKIPNDKVGLIIGKGGETIKYMQTTSGARMQIIPLHLPPGDPSSERTLYVNGSAEQIEAAKVMVTDVINGKRIIPAAPINYSQPVYSNSSSWAQPGQPQLQQQSQYGYNQPEAHPAQYYSSYAAQQPAWDQSNASAIPQTAQQHTGYGYYGQQPPMPSGPLNPSYSYSQTPTSNPYDHYYSQQPASYGQNIAAPVPTTMASQPEGGVSSQPTQATPSYPPPSYSQPMANPQTYWTSSTFIGQQSAQTGYDQTNYSQTDYGGVQPAQPPGSSAQQAYSQSGYPFYTTPPLANYAQGTYPPNYGQPQHETQPPNNGLAVDSNSNTGHGSNPAPPEAVPSES